MTSQKRPSPNSTCPWEQPPPSPNCVTIFGAGIAGLTAAHELVERGYSVQIWEPVSDVRYPHRGCDIGGLARTQWSRVHWEEKRSLDKFKPLGDKFKPPKGKPFFGERTSKIVSLPQKICFMADSDVKLRIALPEGMTDSRLGAALRVHPTLVVTVPGFSRQSRQQRQELASKIAQTIIKQSGVDEAPDSYRQPIDRAVEGHVVVQFRLEGVGEQRLVVTEGPGPWWPGAVGRLVLADEKGAASDSFDILEDWQPGEPIALGAWGAQEVPVVLAEVIDALLGNPEIKHLYVEASHRDLAGLVGRKLLPEETFYLNQMGQNRAAAILSVLAREMHKSGLSPFVSLPELKLTTMVPRDGTRKYTTTMGLYPGGDAPPPRSDAEKEEPPHAKKAPHEVLLEVVVLGEFPSDAPEGASLSLGFRVRERWLPGEHGYRFFPSFYRHVFDTMERTPILEMAEKTALSQEQERSMDVSAPETVRYVESGRTVFHNVQPTEGHVLAFADGDVPTLLPRARPRSLEEIREYIRVLFAPRSHGGFDTSVRDSMRFTLKLFKFMTSCERRRETYEKVSWWKFVDGESYDPGVQRLIQSWPEALVAMDARVADARTHGSSFIQLVLDNLGPAGYRDGTLKGPTTEAWFKHWRAYLEAQGVKFIHGSLDGFEIVKLGDRELVWPKVSCFEPRYPRDKQGQPQLPPGYFVMAVQADRAQHLAKEYWNLVTKASLNAPSEVSDFARAARLRTEGIEQAVPPGDFRHFAGIQFYFAEDVFWVNGHVYYPDSPWSITSISQARFWSDRTDWEHGFRGIVSAIIGTWDRPGTFNKKRAWDCTEEELAKEVWSQIKSAVEKKPQTRVQGTVRFATGSRTRDGAVPDPIYWHLDEGLSRRADGQGYNDRSPFHIATPEGYAGRPGDPVRGYAVENAWVICGMHAKTFTRIPSMEAANESARHAVNAIIKNSTSEEGTQAQRFRKTRCDVWNPEDHEIEDLQWFKDLDQKLMDRGLPHILDILDLDRVAATLLRGGPNDPLDPLTLSRKLMRMASSFLGSTV